MIFKSSRSAVLGDAVLRPPLDLWLVAVAEPLAPLQGSPALLAGCRVPAYDTVVQSTPANLYPRWGQTLMIHVKKSHFDTSRPVSRFPFFGTCSADISQCHTGWRPLVTRGTCGVVGLPAFSHFIVSPSGRCSGGPVSRYHDDPSVGALSSLARYSPQEYLQYILVSNR